MGRVAAVIMPMKIEVAVGDIGFESERHALETGRPARVDPDVAIALWIKEGDDQAEVIEPGEDVLMGRVETIDPRQTRSRGPGPIASACEETRQRLSTGEWRSPGRPQSFML